MTRTQLVGVAILLAGSFGMVSGLVWFFVNNLRSLSRIEPSLNGQVGDSDTSARRRIAITVLLVLVVVMIAGIALRLDGLESKTLSHPEVYVPGIELPAGISEPPPRTTLIPLLFFHFYAEPHPPGYYFVMYGWTKVFGTELYWLRLPSVIFGALSIFLTFLLARTLFGNAVAVLSSALIAFNGHQIYWSQNARMYAMTCFLGLISTWLLTELLSGRNRAGVRLALMAVGYVVTTTVGVYTEIVFWPFLAGQIFFVLARVSTEPDDIGAPTPNSYVLLLQSIVVMLGAPMWAHAVMTGRGSPFDPVSIRFLNEYFAFGFIFERDSFSLPEREISTLVLAGVGLFALYLIAVALRASGNATAMLSSSTPVRTDSGKVSPVLLFIAAFSVVAIAGFSLATDERNIQILMTGFVPIAAISLPRVGRAFQRLSKNVLKTRNYRGILADGRGLLASLCLLPVGLMVAVSLVNSLLTSRLFLLFTPYLLILISAGIVQTARRTPAVAGFTIVLAGLLGWSVVYYRQYPSEALDYRSLAVQMNSNAEPGDVLFVHKGSWVTTPLFYYLDPTKFEFVADASPAVSTQRRRAWLVNFEGQPPTQDMLDALSAYAPVESYYSRRAHAIVFERSF